MAPSSAFLYLPHQNPITLKIACLCQPFPTSQTPLALASAQPSSMKYAKDAGAPPLKYQIGYFLVRKKSVWCGKELLKKAAHYGLLVLLMIQEVLNESGLASSIIMTAAFQNLKKIDA